MSEGSGPLQHQHLTVPPYPRQPRLKCITCRRRGGSSGTGRKKSSGRMFDFSYVKFRRGERRRAELQKQWPSLATAASPAFVSLGCCFFSVFNHKKIDKDQYPVTNLPLFKAQVIEPVPFRIIVTQDVPGVEGVAHMQNVCCPLMFQWFALLGISCFWFQKWIHFWLKFIEQFKIKCLNWGRTI